MRVPTPQDDECAPTRRKQLACADRREPCDDRRECLRFTFESRAIAAFARETAERESHDALTRNCATQSSAHEPRVNRLRTRDHAANARAAHDPHESQAHIIVDSQRISNYSFRS